MTIYEIIEAFDDFLSNTLDYQKHDRAESALRALRLIAAREYHFPDIRKKKEDIKEDPDG